jgi:RNA polymerase sigma-70 factor (ECF subfamily)
MGQLGPDEERSLVELAKCGDVEAFGTLYEHYAPAVFRFIYAHLSDRLDAEDLTEEIFLRAWQALPRYQARGYPFSSFLFKAARNGLTDLYRRVGRSPQEQRLEDRDAAGFEPAAGVESDPAYCLYQAHERAALRQRLSGLGEEQRLVVSLRFFAGLSYEETAQVVGKSQAAVRVIQHRALAALKKAMDEHEA